MLNFLNIGFVDVLLFLLVVGVFFLVIREFVVWYFKINKIIALLDKIEQNTRKDVR